MLNYIIRRLLMVPVLLFGVTILIFSMLQFLTPTERSALYVRDIPKNDRAIQGIITQYGLDQPLHIQYWNWLVGSIDPVSGEREGGILRGDFGYSRTASQDVIDLVKNRLRLARCRVDYDMNFFFLIHLRFFHSLSCSSYKLDF